MERAQSDVPVLTVGRVLEEEREMELLPIRGFELIPKRCDDEAAAEIDVPFELDLDDGDRILATIAKTGTVQIRAVEPDKMFVLGTVIIEGFTPEQARAIAKGFWGRVWARIKAAFRAVLDAITFDGGPYLGTCRADVQVTHVDGVPVGATVGIKCTQ
ncbi:hypothetical protein [Mesorhizobium sp. M0909]|uniref:hypothetical protein n=1 Tax=Mesorhizobium sp. M0909 TaxID=2957024 RepID=UPI003339A98D